MRTIWETVRQDDGAWWSACYLCGWHRTYVRHGDAKRYANYHYVRAHMGKDRKDGSDNV